MLISGRDEAFVWCLSLFLFLLKIVHAVAICYILADVDTVPAIIIVEF